MIQIKVFDKETNRIMLMTIGSNNLLSKEYLSAIFPGATTLYYHDADPNAVIV